MRGFLALCVLCIWASFAAAVHAEGAGDTRVLLVHLHPPVDPLDPALRASLAADISRREHVRALLSDLVGDVQRSVMRFITANNNGGDAVQVSPLWIQNTLVVRLKSGDIERLPFLTQDLRWFPGVLDVEQDFTALRLLDFEREDGAEGSISEQGGGETPQTNIKLLHAPQLWAQGARGKNVVVANIDSGVRYTHEALKDTFRGSKKDGKVDFDYAFWFTPGTDMSKESPDTADLVGHGTHTMGTAVGSKGIGMAPEATWITARAFDIWGAANKSDFLLAAQWVLCPTKMDGSGADCSKGADVVTNSFGVDRASPVYPQWTWLSKVIDTWRAAGVYPVFASGNTNGFLCGSVYYPGSREDTIAVGALMGGSSLWGASGKGPSFEDGYDQDSQAGSSLMSVLSDRKFIIKPDFVAPGVGIRSALSIKDSSYTRLTGTSMATPHVAGAIALLLSLNGSADEYPVIKPPPMEKVLKSLAETTTRDLRKPFLVPSECGNTTYQEYPNNIYGWGLVNACLAAKRLGFPCNDAASLREIPIEGRRPLTLADFVAVE